MSEKEKKILENWAKILPSLSEEERERLVNYTDGAAAMCDMMRKGETEA